MCYRNSHSFSLHCLVPYRGYNQLCFTAEGSATYCACIVYIFLCVLLPAYLVQEIRDIKMNKRKEIQDSSRENRKSRRKINSWLPSSTLQRKAIENLARLNKTPALQSSKTASKRARRRNTDACRFSFSWLVSASLRGNNMDGLVYFVFGHQRYITPNRFASSVNMLTCDVQHLQSDSSSYLYCYEAGADNSWATVTGFVGPTVQNESIIKTTINSPAINLPNRLITAALRKYET